MWEVLADEVPGGWALGSTSREGTHGVALPRRLKFGGQTVTVRDTPAWDMERNGVDGRFHGSTSLIELRTDVPTTNLRDTLLHECLHGLLYVYGIKPAMGWSEDEEEKLVGLLTPVLLALLRDNKSLVEYITAKG